MEPYRVFISSIMNRALEDLFAERAAARAAVDQFAPMTTAGAFESEPASVKPLLDFYIDAVKTSDLFVLILGQHLTKPVRDEYDAARDHGKSMLVFCKNMPSRHAEASELLRSLNAKYDDFVNAVELREKVRKSLGMQILGLIRNESGDAIRAGDRIAQLRRYSRDQFAVRILPLVPRCPFNSFRVTKVDSASVAFEKDSNRETITIPIQRVEDVLDVGDSAPPTVLLNGRLQWLSLLQSWRFLPDKPAADDLAGIGLGKNHPQDDATLGSLLASHGYHCGWSSAANLGGD
jgi:hypothetical protein